MALKIEPRPTGQLVIRAEPDLIARIDRVAAEHKATRSVITRALLRQALQQQG